MKKKITVKKIIVFVVIVAVVATGIFIPKLVHKCDRCSEFFFGTGYDGSFNQTSNKDETILCKDCAQIEFANLLAWGISLDEFKRSLF